MMNGKKIKVLESKIDELEKNIKDLGDKFNRLLESYQDMSKYIDNILAPRVINSQEEITKVRKHLKKHDETIVKLNTAAGIEALEESKEAKKNDEDIMTLYESVHKGA